ncbi:ATP/GTP-binding protein [Candidatus Cyanaurora vandensis]|uniref:ATP/GTP-binding protein n=1 Tax=Candidatus Cyanaurora vandensis TaxID=2714958 RepID=UPI0037BEF0BF
MEEPAAVTSNGGVLLVDEIDTGLHYSAQTSMWRLLMETAERLNVQIFTTTHSWDCVCSFQEALGKVSNSSVGKLFRIETQGEYSRAVVYEPDELVVAVRQSVEVR